ncbi:conserved hypothetical protein [Tenacibaculum maritimum]|uniref:DUF262 domain-containing protein n=1 Tax=Tenacibaculum maritimum TaxID=107401 RepID=UPI0012E5F162|nr:DUF262 domain-containing protein [Tenacibaculum maritimum]CAA0165639.1 conserved hypothetical protein [Tenacibaculum maritimum]CAA0165796.1 conserved hypothetical protein [Tenacibaculum maritimum]CAA0243291.1 conserved hypothetical protein [Tenacibaculum maritimum]
MSEITANKIEVNSLFNDFWFLIPEYQRSYVWNSDNINDLLDDLWYAFKNKPGDEYFLGSLVLKKTSEVRFNEFEVLDGQQRLTTFFMFMAVLRDIAKDEDLKEACHDRIFQKANKFRKIPERVRLVYKIRDNVEDFIKEFVLAKEGSKKEEILFEYIKGKNISINHMANAILTISKFFSNKTSSEIEDFGVFIAEKPVFIYVSTESMEDAFRMFTILNNRGVPLTNADILKSINIGLIHEEEQEKYALIWEDIESDLGKDFDRFLSFIRTIKVKEKARLNLLDEFNENIYDKNRLKKGKETVKLIQNYKFIYDKIITFKDDIGLENEYKNLLVIMQIGLPSTDWIPPLILFYDKFEKENLFSFIEKLEYKFSSDWINQLTPTKRIDNLNNILKAIEKYNTSSELLKDNTIFTVDKIELERRLSGNVYGRRFTRYVLLKYEYLLGDNTVHLSNYKTISVEHVLPQNPKLDSFWINDFNALEREEWTHKLSNLVLISMKKNSKLGNLDFERKKERYLKGRIDIFPSNKIFQNYTKWDVNTLIIRQKMMIESLIK